MSSNAAWQLPDEIYSLQALQAVLNECQQNLSLLRRKQKPAAWSPAAMAVFEANGVDSINVTALSEVIGELRIAQQRPVVIIRTPSVLLPTLQLRIRDYLAQIVGPGVLLSFQTDATLLAGLVIQTPQQRLDYSLRTGLEAGKDYLRQVVHA